MREVGGIPRYRYNELIEMPTLRQGHTDDLKYEKDRLRIWLARTTLADGEPFEHTATVEIANRKTGRWETLYQYDADRPMTITNELRDRN